MVVVVPSSENAEGSSTPLVPSDGGNVHRVEERLMH